MTTLKVEIDKEKDLPALTALLNRWGLKFRIEDTNGKDEYDPEFVAKIERGRKQAAGGKITVIKPEDLWK